MDLYDEDNDDDFDGDESAAGNLLALTGVPKRGKSCAAGSRPVVSLHVLLLCLCTCMLGAAAS